MWPLNKGKKHWAPKSNFPKIVGLIYTSKSENCFVLRKSSGQGSPPVQASPTTTCRRQPSSPAKSRSPRAASPAGDSVACSRRASISWVYHQKHPAAAFILFKVLVMVCYFEAKFFRLYSSKLILLLIVGGLLCILISHVFCDLLSKRRCLLIA